MRAGPPTGPTRGPPPSSRLRRAVGHAGHPPVVSQTSIACVPPLGSPWPTRTAPTATIERPDFDRDVHVGMVTASTCTPDHQRTGDGRDPDATQVRVKADWDQERQPTDPPARPAERSAWTAPLRRLARHLPHRRRRPVRSPASSSRWSTWSLDVDIFEHHLAAPTSQPRSRSTRPWPAAASNQPGDPIDGLRPGRRRRQGQFGDLDSAGRVMTCTAAVHRCRPDRVELPTGAAPGPAVQ